MIYPESDDFDNENEVQIIDLDDSSNYGYSKYNDNHYLSESYQHAFQKNIFTEVALEAPKPIKSYINALGKDSSAAIWLVYYIFVRN